VDLANHDTGGGGGKEGEGCDEFSDGAAGGDNRGFFDAHGDHDFFVVDDKLRHNREGKAHDSNNIFSHGIGDVKFQSSSD
jgi:hypothetical protein